MKEFELYEIINNITLYLIKECDSNTGREKAIKRIKKPRNHGSHIVAIVVIIIIANIYLALVKCQTWL